MNKFTIKFGLASILACVLLISSCSKDSSNALVPEGTIVRLNIGQAYAKNTPAKAASVGRTYASATQTVEIPFDNQYTLVASLIAEETAVTGLKASNRAATASTGSEQQPLKPGTKYYVAIFDAEGEYKETKSFTQGSGSQDFTIEKGKYTFIIYASGSGKALPSIAVGAKLNTVNFEGLTADQDFMLDQVPFEVKDGQNILNADLEHLFTQVTLKFDASAVGAVTSIDAATIEPSSTTVDVKLTDGIRTWSESKGIVPFKLTNTTGTVINSDSTFITTAATSSAKILLSGVSIGGSAAKSVPSNNWTLRPGVKYILEFKLKAPLGGINVGGHIWAPGNLVYNPNGKYSFAAPTELGSNWYYNWLTPVGVGVAPKNKWASANNVGDMPGYSVERDPCRLVSSEWRTPSQAEYAALINSPGAVTNWQYQNNGVYGAFFGSNNLQAMSQNPGSYLFFRGTGTVKYWTSTNNDDSRAVSIQVNPESAVNGNVPEDKYDQTNIQIRCVRN